MVKSANPNPKTLAERKAEAVRQGIAEALADNGGCIAAAARDLAISRVTLYRLMAAHDIRIQPRAIPMPTEAEAA